MWGGGGEGGGGNLYLRGELSQLPVFIFSFLSSSLAPWLQKWAKVFTGGRRCMESEHRGWELTEERFREAPLPLSPLILPSRAPGQGGREERLKPCERFLTLPPPPLQTPKQQRGDNTSLQNFEVSFSSWGPLSSLCVPTPLWRKKRWREREGGREGDTVLAGRKSAPSSLSGQ